MDASSNSRHKQFFAEVAVPVPVRKVFDYKVPPALTRCVVKGIRVVVPFGRRQVIGLVTRIKQTVYIGPHRLKAIDKCVDVAPVYPGELIKLLYWAADYYQHPVGDVFKTALPGFSQPRNSDRVFTYTPNPEINISNAVSKLVRAPRQSQLFEFIRNAAEPLSVDEIKVEVKGWRSALNELLKKQLVKEHDQAPSWQGSSSLKTVKSPGLTQEQSQVLKQLITVLGGFEVCLLKGVTGSGKTEIYLRLAQIVLDRDQQILILVPEIALTPQLVSRFEQRLGLRAAILHSAMSEYSRRQAWQAASDGRARIVLGTRSAVFTAMACPGLVIIDEEHDLSYKQQEGFRYHARDVAIMRSRFEGIPVLLGSATPSLETLANVHKNRYRMYELNQRIGKSVMPDIHLLSMGQLPTRRGLSVPLLNAIDKNLKAGRQSMIFINRRGFAPVVMCKTCGEQYHCKRCNARLTWHQDNTFRCHHCGSCLSDCGTCQKCQSGDTIKLGLGTQRVEQALGDIFPQARIARMDRDAIRNKSELEAVLDSVSERQVDILVGTQMLSKGHDFPAVTLVGVVNADQGLFGMDFHSTETMVQQLIQVAGRSGRAEDKGQVLIQSHFSDHPIYHHVRRHDYMGFASAELYLRRNAGFPPYRYLALIRVSALDEESNLNFLYWIKRIAVPILADFQEVSLMDPVASPMVLRKGRYRAQMLINSGSRGARHTFLKRWINEFETSKRCRGVRWSIDVDPLDLY